MDDVGTLAGDNARARKYQEGWTHHQSESSKDWNKFWIVLRGSMLFVFETESTRRSSAKTDSRRSKGNQHDLDVMVGTLTLNQEAECKSLPGDTKKKGYKMELITVSAEGRRQMNKFKFASQNERDLWKSFVVGISQGIIPSDVHLLPGQLKNVHEAMAEVRNTPPPLPNIPRPSTLLPRPKVSQNSMNSESSFSSNHAPQSVRSYGSNESSDSGSFHSHVTSPKNSRSMSLSPDTEEVTNLRQLMRRQSDLAFKALDTGGAPFRNDIEADRGFSRENSAPTGFATTARAYHDTSATFSPKGDDRPPPPPMTHTLGGLTRRKSIDAPRPEFGTTARVVVDPPAFSLPKHGHLFYTNDRGRDSPSWFFEECSRDQAEGMLTVGRKYGNVLMRPSSTHKDTGKYVLSMRREVSGGTQLNHYSIAVISSGFKIDVDNKHNPMRCLSDVMDFFVSVAGPGTRPMTCNDIAKIYGKDDFSQSQSIVPPSPTTMHPSWKASSVPSSYSSQTSQDSSWGSPAPPPLPPDNNTGTILNTRGHVADTIQSAVRDMNSSQMHSSDHNASVVSIGAPPPPLPPAAQHYLGNQTDYMSSGGRNDQYGGGVYQDDAPEDQRTSYLKPDGWDPSSPTRVPPGYLSMNGVSTEGRRPPATLPRPENRFAEENNNEPPRYFHHNPTLNKTVPVKNVPSETLMRNQPYQMDSMTHGFNSMHMSHTADVPTPPPPPPIETIPSGIPHPPAPPFIPPPPTFNPAPPPQPPAPTFQSPVSPSYNSAPQRKYSEGNHSMGGGNHSMGGGNHSMGGSAALSFEEELAARLKPKREQIYADATILTSN